MLTFEICMFGRRSAVVEKSLDPCGSLRAVSHLSQLLLCFTMPPAPSSTRALTAILPLIASGQPYEAHQKARTFASRYIKSSQYEVAIEVLFQSARELLKENQQGSGCDLATFMLEVYETAELGVDDQTRGELGLEAWGLDVG